MMHMKLNVQQANLCPSGKNLPRKPSKRRHQRRTRRKSKYETHFVILRTQSEYELGSRKVKSKRTYPDNEFIVVGFFVFHERNSFVNNLSFKFIDLQGDTFKEGRYIRRLVQVREL